MIHVHYFCEQFISPSFSFCPLHDKILLQAAPCHHTRRKDSLMADISVIIPCYNVAPYIDRCLTSVINQTLDLSFFQIICVDDASTDNTWQYLQEWEARCPETIMIIHCDENGRQGKARNIAMEYCNTPWVSFIDADDWIEPDYFEKMYAIALQCQCDIVSCDQLRDPSRELTYLEHRENGKESGLIVINTITQRKAFIASESMYFTACSKLIRTELLADHQITFPENIAYEDYFWGSLLYFYAHRIFILEEFLYHYFVNPHSTALTKNADYHIDILTISLMEWEEWQKRNFFTDYKEEVEFLFLNSCYYIFMKMIIMRYDVPSFSLFQLCKQLVTEHIPDFFQNPYSKKLTEFHKLLLHPLQHPLCRSDFYKLAESAKEYWKYNR